MSEVRTTSSTGGQKGVKLQRFDLVPVGPLAELAEHYGVGASKYANHQWRQGYEWSKSYAALMRHLTAFWNGEDYDLCSNDPEGCKHTDAEGNPFVAVREDACFNHTGSHHMAAVAWHAFCLLEFKDRYPEHDDRYKPEPVDGEEAWDVRAWLDALSTDGRKVAYPAAPEPLADEEILDSPALVVGESALFPEASAGTHDSPGCLDLKSGSLWVIPEGEVRFGPFDPLPPEWMDLGFTTLDGARQICGDTWTTQDESMTITLQDTHIDVLRLLMGLPSPKPARFVVSLIGETDDLENPIAIVDLNAWHNRHHGD